MSVAVVATDTCLCRNDDGWGYNGDPGVDAEARFLLVGLSTG